MLSKTIRKKFLDYFEKNGHYRSPSSSVIPHDDPSLLFINAGMNQFKDTFLGKSQRDYKRACSSQKCIRMGGKHNDLENVGHTSRHLTFFEMLGNFSFGDYFKTEAIDFAWEMSCNVFELDPEKIWITVYEKDDEAYELWQKHVPESKIFRFKEKDNFWAMGDTGPCGPCSELYYDRGPKYSPARNPAEDEPLGGERFLEFWNLVFMQFNRDAKGNLNPLTQTGIDTGAGLERVVGLKLGADSVFETDILHHLIKQVEKISNVTYDTSQKTLYPAFHVIADHVRSLAFSIADGAQPSNLDRGYVLRKTLRRAHRYGKMLNLHDPFLHKVLPALIETMADDFPELKASQTRIEEILTLEEEAFIRTLSKGGNLLQSIVSKSQKSKEKIISGDDAFKMKDTYGFPLEEIELIAKDAKLSIDVNRYKDLELQAKELSKKAQKSHHEEAHEGVFKELANNNISSSFSGFEQTTGSSKILAIIKKQETCDTLTKGEEGWVILDNTPFYAEKGGQVGDTGLLQTANSKARISDTQTPYTQIIAHFTKVEEGSLKVSDQVEMAVNGPRRHLIESNHTATHLLHWGLCQVLGTHITQAGSYVDDKRIRFDFNHHKSVTLEEIREVECLVNERIRENQKVNCYELSYQEAQKSPDIKQFFGDKYGKTVRVVDAGFSKELCGGTHTSQIGNIGYFKISKESSIAAGVRRVEALTGAMAERLVTEKENIIHQLSSKLKTPAEKLLDRIEKNQEESAKLSIELKKIKKEQSLIILDNTFSKKMLCKTVPCIIEQVEIDAKELKTFANNLLQKLQSGILVLAISSNDKCQIFSQVSEDFIAKGFSANDIIKAVAPLIKGGGGGKADCAQAGGTLPNELTNALTKAKEVIEQKC
jgi:alanyl-tRNA synthetase